ncbi:MAG: PD40 domain-containing protein [Acidobacteriia bacterium]|nr:PD40 domain-containing protein [Terriglobia bacterium]
MFLEDRKHFLYMVYNGGSDGGIYAGSLDANPAQQSTKLLFRAQGLLTYLPSTSRVLFVRVGALYSQAFNTRNLAAEGEPIVVQQQVAVETNLLFARASVSEKNLVFRSSSGEDLELTWLDRNGKPLDTIGEAGHYTVLSVLALSRDGTRAAVSRPDASGNFDIWLIDLKTGAGTRFTFDPAYDTAPVWSSDGSRVIFLSVGRRGGTGLYEKATNGAGAERVVLQPGSARTITDWSRDGRYLLFNGSDTLWVLPLEGERKPIPFLRDNFEGVGARLSPDGRWIAFRSRESGRDEIYVESFSPVVDGGTAASTSKWMVSRDGGAGMIHWRQDGKELFYLALDGSMMSVPVTAGPAFHAGTPERLFSVPAAFMRSNTPGNVGDVSPDGQRFLLALPKGGDRQEFTVVTNWQSASRAQ